MPVMRSSRPKISASGWFSHPRMYFSPARPSRAASRCPRRDVGHVDQIEAGVERGEHPPEQVVHDHLARRGGLHFPGADGIRRVDDHDGQPTGGVFVGHALGEELRAFVGADHVVAGDRRRLGAGPAVLGNAERTDARGIDHALDARSRAGLEHVARALHVVAVDLGRIPGPEPIVGGDVEDEPAALDRRAQGVGLEDVAADELGRAAFERPEAARRASQHSDAAALGHQLPRQIGSHEAGGARDQHIHGYATPWASLLPIGQRGVGEADDDRSLPWMMDFTQKRSFPAPAARSANPC